MDKFQTEEVASNQDIPLYALLVKEGDEDVMSSMKKEMAEGANEAEIGNMLGVGRGPK